MHIKEENKMTYNLTEKGRLQKIKNLEKWGCVKW